MILNFYFGAAGYSDFIIHKDEAREQRQLNRHKHNENLTKSGINGKNANVLLFITILPLTSNEINSSIII
jgi:hypothetical protein